MKSLFVRDVLPADICGEALLQIGAVGDIIGHVLNADGEPVDHEINVRIIGISPDDLARYRMLFWQPAAFTSLDHPRGPAPQSCSYAGHRREDHCGHPALLKTQQAESPTIEGFPAMVTFPVGIASTSVRDGPPANLGPRKDFRVVAAANGRHRKAGCPECGTVFAVFRD